MIKLLNDQITHENVNEMKYRAVQGYFEDCNLHGFAKYFETQAHGEHTHREKIINYMNDKNAHITFQSVSPYTEKFADVREIANFYYATEIGTTKKLYAIVKAAQDEVDIGTVAWLYRSDGLILEQIEEEASALDFKSQINRIYGPDNQLNGLGLETLNQAYLG